MVIFAVALSVDSCVVSKLIDYLPRCVRMSLHVVRTANMLRSLISSFVSLYIYVATETTGNVATGNVQTLFVIIQHYYIILYLVSS